MAIISWRCTGATGQCTFASSAARRTRRRSSAMMPSFDAGFPSWGACTSPLQQATSTTLPRTAAGEPCPIVPSSRCRVTRIRGSKLCEPFFGCAALVLVAVALGCGCARSTLSVQGPTGDRAGVARTNEGPTSERPPRKPDAVVVEPPPALPSPLMRAAAHGVVSLREPFAGDAVVALVQFFLEAWQRESLDALQALLTSDAGPIDARGRGRSALVETFGRPLHSPESGRLPRAELFRPAPFHRSTCHILTPPDP